MSLTNEILLFSYFFALYIRRLCTMGFPFCYRLNLGKLQDVAGLFKHMKIKLGS